MKLQARNFVVRKPETIDITVFFKKFCIATRTTKKCSKSLILGTFRHFLTVLQITENARLLNIQQNIQQLDSYEIVYNWRLTLMQAKNPLLLLCLFSLLMTGASIYPASLKPSRAPGIPVPV